MKLTVTQLKARNLLLHYLQSAKYVTVPNHCLCGNFNDLIIASQDRYGIPLMTKLCRNCGLVRSDPYYSQPTLKHFYGNLYRQLYSSHKLTTAAQFQAAYRGAAQISEFVMPWLRRNSVVFDVGCGSGATVKYFSDQGHTTFGCDYSKDYIRYGKKLGLRLYYGSVEKLRKRGPADLILLNHVLEHFPDPLSELKQIRTLLKPQGLLLIGVPGIFDIHRSYKGLAEFIQNAHAFHFTQRTLDRVLASTGFIHLSSNSTILAVYRKGKPRLTPLHQNPWHIYLYLSFVPILKWFHLTSRRLENNAVLILNRLQMYNLIRSGYRFIKHQK